MAPWNREHWARLSGYLDEVLELEPAGRESWLVALGATQPEVAAELRELLATHAVNSASAFLEHSLLEAAQSLIGERIGAYRVDRLLGRGGMGTVWLASRCDGKFEGVAAIKILDRRGLGPSAAERIRNEASLLARLSHPNIARLFDAGVRENGQPYLILEYVEGEPIDRFCSERQLPLAARLQLVLAVLDAVAHAHAQLIVHRDLKPSNVLVTPEASVKLLDFGIASLQAPEVQPAPGAEGPQPLTPGYAAPEQLRGEPVSAASDVYSLGALLHVLVTGVHPSGTAGSTHTELARATLTADAPPASERIASARGRRQVRGDLDAIIAKALRREAAQRYATAAELAADVRSFLGGFPVAARRATRAYVAQKFARRHWGGILSAMLTLTVLIGASVVTTLNMFEARRQRDVARSELRRTEAANDFSSLMLEEVGQGGKLLSRDELLDRGVQLLDARYGGDREFVADMLIQLAARYGDEERIDKEITLTRRSLEIARQTTNASLLTRTLCEAARQEMQGGSHPDVDPWLAEAQGLLAGLHDPPMDTRVTCLRAQAERASTTGHLEEAAALLSEAHGLQVAEGLSTGLSYTSVLTELGGVYFDQGRYPEAYLVSKEVGVAFDRGGRGGTLGRGIIHQNVASTLLRMGEPRAALTELEAARPLLPGSRAGQPRSGFQSALALTLRRLGRLQEADETIAGEGDRLLAADNPRLGSRALMEEGVILAGLNEPDQARSLLERALAIMSKNTQVSAGLSQANASLADLDTSSGHADTARRRLEAYLAAAGYARERTKPILQPVLVSAARAALAQGDAAAAQRYADDALAIASKNARGPDSSADVGETLLLMARIRLAARDPVAARSLLARAARCLANGLGSDAPLAVEARRLMESTGTDS